jgi:preprotein translocase subunit SecA
MISFLSKIFGDPNEKYLKGLEPVIKEINSLESQFKDFSTEDFKKKTEEFKKRIDQGESLDHVLPEAFALVREAAKRTLGQRHYDVQLIGGIVLHQGKIAEMKTGEGKTLAATLPLYLNALTGKGAHLVTVNDYLARRDTVWMGQVYHLLGLSTGCIVSEESFLYDPAYQREEDSSQEDKEGQPQRQGSDLDKERDEVGGFKVIESYLKPVKKKEAYQADITYGTNNEFGFDYLRDNMVFSPEQLVQRGFHYAIVDEVDSILIDEARTPLIISQPDMESSNWYKDFARIIPRLKKDEDYDVDEKMKTVTLTEEGIEKVEQSIGVSDIYTDKGIKYLHHLEQALRAGVFFQRDRDYIVREGKVVIVDQFTGRLMPKRRYSGGLHQAIEAKEGLTVLPESKTLASITFQNYFRFYKKLAGMTGTAVTSAEELDKVYGLEVIVIPTNKPMQRTNLGDSVYKNEKGKFQAIVREVKKRNEKGQPILIGTTSIEKNEYLAKLLDREGIDCRILNAKNHEQEGQIIAQAGKSGTVTVATNMAGRGVDIILGGNPPDSQDAEKVKSLGGLHVIGTERHEARRIDNQLRGRAGRQGDPGSSQFFISLEDDLMRIFGGERIQSLMEMLKVAEDQPIEASILSGSIEKAQAKVEGMNFDLRKRVLEYDDIISKHRKRIYSQRREVLEKEYPALKDFILAIVEKEIGNIVTASESDEGFDYARIGSEIKTIFPLPAGAEEELNKLSEKEDIERYLFEMGKRFFQEKEKREGRENMEKVLRFIPLKIIDSFWSEHLDTMDRLKDSVRLRAYGGRDPIVEYKTEGHRIFRELESVIASQISRLVFKLSVSQERKDKK